MEIVQRMLEAADRRDGTAMFAAYDPDIEWDVTDVPERFEGSVPADLFGVLGVFRGHDAVRGWFREWFSAWERVDFEHEQLIDAGDHVVEEIGGPLPAREA